MVRTSVLNDALTAIYNAEKAGKRQVMVRPSSKVIVKFLGVMQKHGRSIALLHLQVAPAMVSTHHLSMPSYQGWRV